MGLISKSLLFSGCLDKSNRVLLKNAHFSPSLSVELSLGKWNTLADLPRWITIGLRSMATAISSPCVTLFCQGKLPREIDSGSTQIQPSFTPRSSTIWVDTIQAETWLRPTFNRQIHRVIERNL